MTLKGELLGAMTVPAKEPSGFWRLLSLNLTVVATVFAKADSDG